MIIGAVGLMALVLWLVMGNKGSASTIIYQGGQMVSNLTGLAG